MSMQCGQCKGKHEFAWQVRQCYSLRSDQAEGPRGPSDKQISLAQSLAREKERLQEYADLEQKDYENKINEMSKSEISDFISAMLKQPNLPGVGEIGTLHPEVPEGRYALRTDGGTIQFYQLRDATRGNPRRIYQLFGAPGEFTRKRVWRPASVLNRIAENPRLAAELFGVEMQICAVCGSPLTNALSRERGIGPDCLKKL